MCRRHESTLTGDMTAPREARRLVAAECADLGVGELSDTAQLLTSELVTNAVVHAHGDPSVGVALACGRLVIDVRDEDPAFPQIQDVGTEPAGGRGLAIVELLAEDWGIRPERGGGKAVWFALRPRRAPQAAQDCQCTEASAPGAVRAG